VTIPDGPLPPPTAAGTHTGRVLDGRYRVDGLLGHGGMSEVYLGRQLALDRPCAIKLLRPPLGGGHDQTDRFSREAAALSRIGHPNVCPVIDFGTTQDGLRYLVMGHLDGQPLSRTLAEGRPPPARALAIFADCAAGLEAAHTAGVVHRDVKAENVMLTTRGGRETAVLIDFGIARPQDSGEVTRDGVMVGTPEVMSPEQVAGDPVGPASDQYQLGLLLARMLTGALPFPGATTQERMVNRLTMPPEPLQALLPGLEVPPALQQALDRALARSPGDRFPSVAAFAAAVAGASPATSDAATEVLPRPETIGRGGPRKRPMILGAAALVVLAAVVWNLRPGPPAPAAEEQADPAAVAVAEEVPHGTRPTPAPPPPAAPAAGPERGQAVIILPDEDLVFSPDPAVRRAAREIAEQVYRSGSAADTVRAEAAFLVAVTHREDGALAEARTWLQHCLALQERAMCRRLLAQLP
jgi:serine/threonine-protein kinase